MVFFEKEKEGKKRNESTKQAKESEERSKEQMSEIEEKKRDLLYYLFYSNLCMKNNVARCIRAVQKRQEVNFNNSFFYTI